MKKYILDNMMWAWLLIAMLIWFVILFAPYNKEVTLDQKHWECVSAITDGLDTQCTEFRFKGK